MGRDVEPPEAPGEQLMHVVASPAPLGELAPTLERARVYAAASKAAETRRAYASRWGLFAAWCQAHELPSLPAAPEHVALYLTELADRGLAAATIELSLVAIAQNHVAAGHTSPRAHAAVREVRAGIRRTIGTEQKGKAPLLAGGLRVAANSPRATHLATLRDRALLLIGWNGAFRRGELHALNLEDVRFAEQGLELHLARSKTDQQGRGRTVPIPRARRAEVCPERALRAWLEAAGITAGAIFLAVDRWDHLGERLSGHAICEIVKAAAALAGLDPRDFGAHSIRAGLVTEAARQGKGEAAIMKITGHVSVQMVRRYMREADRWRDVASDGLLDG